MDRTRRKALSLLDEREAKLIRAATARELTGLKAPELEKNIPQARRYKDRYGVLAQKREGIEKLDAERKAALFDLALERFERRRAQLAGKQESGRKPRSQETPGERKQTTGSSRKRVTSGVKPPVTRRSER